MKKYRTIILLLFPFVVCGQDISTYVGNGTAGCLGFGALATSANITDPLGCTFDILGNFYFCNQQCNMVCKVDAAGIITTIAGPGTIGVIGDGGPALTAYLNYPNTLAFDNSGNLYIADAGNYRIRKINMTTGIISTVAGVGSFGYGGDGGPATAATISGVNGICIDKHGNLYISDANNNRIRKVNINDTISTFAGTGIAGFSGDGFAATNARINQPFDLKIDATGNLFFPDAGNKRIRKIDTLGIISTIAGTGIGLYSGDDVPATAANFGPYKIAIDSFENIYVSDSNDRIREIDDEGIIHTIAGTGVLGYNGDGILADTAQLKDPSGIAVDRCGNVYFGDVGNARIRQVNLPVLIPVISLSGVVNAAVGSTVTITAIVSNAGSSYAIYWMNHGSVFATTTIPTTSYTKTSGTDTITARIVPIGYACKDSVTTSSPHFVELSEGVSTLSTTGGLLIYPNPVTGSLNISLPGIPITQVTISNIFGQVVIAQTFSANNVSLDVSGLPPAVYFVKVNDIYVQKFIKQ